MYGTLYQYYRISLYMVCALIQTQWDWKHITCGVPIEAIQ